MKWFALLSVLGAVSASALAQDSIAVAAAPAAPQHDQQLTKLHDHLMAILKDALKDLDAKTRDKVIQKVMAALKSSNALGTRDSILIAPAAPGRATSIPAVPLLVKGDGENRNLVFTPASIAQDSVVIRRADGNNIAIAPKAQKADRVIQMKPGANTSISKTINVQSGNASVVLDGVDAADVIVIVNGKKYRLVPIDGKAGKVSKATKVEAIPHMEGMKIEGIPAEVMKELKPQIDGALKGLNLAELKELQGMKLEGLDGFQTVPGMKLEGLEGLEGLDEFKNVLPEIMKMLKELKLEGAAMPADLFEKSAPIKNAEGGRVVWYDPTAKPALSQTSMQKYEQLAKEMEARARDMEKSGMLQKRFAGAKELEMTPSELAKMVEQMKRDAGNQKLDIAKMKKLELAAQDMKRNASSAKTTELVEMAKRLEKLAKELLEEAHRAGAK